MVADGSLVARPVEPARASGCKALASKTSSIWLAPASAVLAAHRRSLQYVRVFSARAAPVLHLLQEQRYHCAKLNPLCSPLIAMSTAKPPRVNTMSAAERVGQLLGNDIAGRVIECFDFCLIQSRVAACVSVRWSTLAVQRRELIENAFWDEPGPDAVAEAHVRMDDFNDSMEETIAQNAAAVTAASQGDPVADHLRRLGRTRGAHVVDAGESSVASYVTYAEYLPTNGHKHRVLIVARDEDLGKWVAAFSGKPYYRGDFDACPNFAEYDYDTAEPLNLSLIHI